MFDIIIKNGIVIDGTNKPKYKSDIGINSNKIEKIGSLENTYAKKIIDASGLIISPGFIDIHTHSDISVINDPLNESKIFQGVTTEVTGNCSYSPFPSGNSDPNTLKEELWEKRGNADDPNTIWEWTTFDEYAKYIEEKQTSLNIAPQVGYAALQIASGSVENRRATEDELEKMKKLANESIEQGAFSLSTGLSVPPSAFASTEEIIEICKSISHYDNVFYVTHAREGAGRHISKIKEAVEIGIKSNISVQFSHLAITDWRYYGEGPKMHKIFEDAEKQGLDITYDMYPYTAAGAGLDQTMPLWSHSGGIEVFLERLKNPKTREKIKKETMDGIDGLPQRWETIVVSSVKNPKNKNVIGLSIEEIAKKRNLDIGETVMQLTEEEQAVVSVIFHNRVEEDIQCFMDHRLAMFGSDGNAVSKEGFYKDGKPHPRFYGTFPRILGRYIREKRSSLSLEEAIHKMTGFPAWRLGLKQRGEIRKNYIADLTIFNPNTVKDLATFENPHQYSIGIQYVIVNGEVVVSNGIHTKKTPGKVLRRSQSS
tara:strand:- start:10254 stop:11873 length:1620 start_codon:yes stop_codon:yes gene_type:complete